MIIEEGELRLSFFAAERLQAACVCMILPPRSGRRIRIQHYHL